MLRPTYPRQKAEGNVGTQRAASNPPQAEGRRQSQAGIYFVTICTARRRHRFADPAARRVAEQQWRALANAGARGRRGPRVHIDTWVVMPNHVHGIIVITAGGIDNDSDADPDHAPGAAGGPSFDHAPGAGERHRSIIHPSPGVYRA